MTIAVIGAGRIGSAIARRLAGDGHAVMLWGDLDDLDGLAVALSRHAPAAIVVAAGPPRHAGFRLDRRTLIGHVMVAERVRAYAETSGSAIVLVSSTAARHPRRPPGYGAVKGLVEHIVRGPRTVIVRAGTVVGGLDDRNQSVLHRFVRAVAAGRPCRVDDPRASVSFVTLDQLAGIVTAIVGGRRKMSGATWAGTVADLARLVRHRAGPARDRSSRDGMMPMIDAMLAHARRNPMGPQGECV